MTSGCGLSGLTTATREDSSDNGALFYLYSGRGSSNNVHRIGEVAGVRGGRVVMLRELEID
ncbi:MAG TPA: hypothetical protein VEP90_07570 [Methylomirabilota bacterium]|nr:hypothetical protein [Methylomirabilota bacterium]